MTDTNSTQCLCLRRKPLFVNKKLGVVVWAWNLSYLEAHLGGT